MASATEHVDRRTEGLPAMNRRSGRRPGSSGTREAIIRAARKLFAEYGYGGASMRAIAREANVDAALIHHFFATKEGVFAAAIEDAFHPTELVTELLESGADDLGSRLLRAVLERWGDPGNREPLLAVVRSAVSHPDAARLTEEFVTTHVVGRLTKAIGVPHSELRATLVGSQIIGLVMVRFVLRIEPLASVHPEVVVASLGPLVHHSLTGELDLPAGVGQQRGEGG
jgi:AcrR family transcriptional regulator